MGCFRSSELLVVVAGFGLPQQGERLYGPSSLVVDLGLGDRFTFQQLMRDNAANGQAASSSQPARGPRAKSKAVELKRKAKHEIWNAYQFYRDVDSLNKENIIMDTSGPLQSWYASQVTQLVGVESSRLWAIDQCKRSYWTHIKDTLGVIADTPKYRD